MSGKFTPGPWSVVIESGQIPPTAICSESLPFIASIHTDFSDLDATEANARLIAAAPDLLFWLEEMLKNLPKNRDWLDPQIEREAKAAIARAKGESK